MQYMAFGEAWSMNTSIDIDNGSTPGKQMTTTESIDGQLYRRVKHHGNANQVNVPNSIILHYIKKRRYFAE